MLGGVFAMIMESMDMSIGTIEDMERYLAIPVLGVIPHLDEKMVKEKLPEDVIRSDDTSEKMSPTASLFSHFVPQEPISEAVRSLRAHLEILFKRNSWKTLMVTSSVLREGKTSTACNLAVIFAQAGQRTLLIDADLRRPQIHKVFGLSKTPGLSDILFGVSDWESSTRSMDDIILGEFGSKNSQITPGLEHLFLLTAGRSVDNPAELLHFEKFSKFLSEIRDHYDVIIVDIAPVLPVAEALQIASGVDAILLAYQIGRVGRDVTKRTKDRLESVGGNIVGLVMNDIQAEMQYTDDYQYYSGYKAITVPSEPSLGPLTRLKERLSKFITPGVS
jgi:capsular exopolysaccharide synthesis family protein